MAPLGKFTLSVIGLRLFGAAGFFWGMFLGHLLIDHSLVGKWIENRLSELDDNVRLLLPYGFTNITAGLTTTCSAKSGERCSARQLSAGAAL